MKTQGLSELKKFDIRDHDWTLVSWSDRELTIHVTTQHDNWEYEGEPFVEANITFLGFRLEWAKRFEKEKGTPLTFEEAMQYFSEEPLFVFSYGVDERGCEICGLKTGDPLAMAFQFEDVLIDWEPARPVEHIGTLRKL